MDPQELIQRYKQAEGLERERLGEQIDALITELTEARRGFSWWMGQLDDLIFGINVAIRRIEEAFQTGAVTDDVIELSRTIDKVLADMKSYV